MCRSWTRRFISIISPNVSALRVAKFNPGRRFAKLEDVDQAFDLVINCSGIGARTLVQDLDLEPHRGQVAIVPKIDLPYAVVCDGPPLMYAIPRSRDCVFGGTNQLSADCTVDPAATAQIVGECSRVLMIDEPDVLAERVGLRPFRRSGVRVERAQLRDGRTAHSQLRPRGSRIHPLVGLRRSGGQNRCVTIARSP